MIYTVTLNPSLDHVVFISHFDLGAVNRIEKELLFPGGKGINVSIVLKELGMDSTILGFAAGFSGEEICRRLKELGCREELILLPEGYSRINIKLRAEKESELNGAGPLVGGEGIAALYKKLDNLEKKDVLVLSGSIPASMPDDIYRDILRRIEGKGVMTVVDTAGAPFVHTLPCHPFLIKPNDRELGELFGVRLREKKEVVCYAEKLQEKGARNVLVSMGAAGAILLTEEGAVYTAAAPKGTAVNSVGAGDSVVAGFLYGILCYGDYEAAFRLGVAAGSASAFSEHLAVRTRIEELEKQVEISAYSR